MITFFIALGAMSLDCIAGEPRRFHPLAAFGWLAARAEGWLHGPRRWRGAVAAALTAGPPALAAAWLASPPGAASAVFSVAALYFALGARSLHDHASAVAGALRLGDDGEARRRAGLMVSRDADALDPANAAVESALENGNDAVFGALFWFAVAGAGGAVFYRLVNTLDAMWGYRNERYRAFGWAAARLDDLLNWAPARLTALTYAVLGNWRLALACWRTQAPAWESPNAGPVMAAGAGALGVTLGGPARYGGAWRLRPILGAGPAPGADDIGRALALVRRGAVLWLCAYGLLKAADWGLAHA